MRGARSVILFLLLFGVISLAQNEELRTGGAGGSLVCYRPGDYVAFENFQTYNTSLLTIEFWLKSRSFSSLFTPISYAIPGIGLRFAWLGCQGIRWMGQEFLFANPGSIGTVNQALVGLSDVHAWHHYALVWSGLSGIFQLYVDGELWATAYFEFSKGNVFESGGTLVLGQLQTTPGRGFESQYSFQGMIDELRVWKSLRTRAEIRQWMHTPIQAWNETDLISYYNFDTNRTSDNQLLDVLSTNTGSFGNWDLDSYTLNASASVSPVIGSSTAPVVDSEKGPVFYVDVDSGRNIFLPYLYGNEYLSPNVSISITRMPSNNIYQYIGGSRVLIPTAGPISSSSIYFDPVQLIFPDAKFDSFDYSVITEAGTLVNVAPIDLLIHAESESGTVLIVASQAVGSVPMTAKAFQQADKVINLICYDINGNDLQPVITALPTSGAIYHLPNATHIDKSLPIVAPNSLVDSPINSVVYTPVSNLRNFQDGLSYSCALRGSSTWSSAASKVFLTVELSSQRPLAGSGLWALEFNGINNYAITDKNNTRIDQIFTLSAWIRVTGTNPQQTIIAGICDNEVECLSLYLDYNGTTFRLCMSLLNASLSTNTLCEVVPNMQTAYWTHFAFGVTPTSEITLYSNGSIMATKSNSSIVFLPKQMVLGAGWSSTNLTFNNYFAGRMDEIRIWGYPIQVSSTMRSRPAEDDPLLVAYWDFNNGQGQNTPDVTKQGIRTLWNSNSSVLGLNIFNTPKRYSLAALNTTSSNNTVIDPLKNAFILGGGFAAYQPSYVVSDGPSFNTHITREDDPILLRLDASSLLFSSVARVITSLPQKGVLYQVTNIGELLYDRPISDPYLSWDVRYPIEQWVSNVLNYSSFNGDYLNSSYSPFNLIGRPAWYDLPNPSYGDNVNSWAPEWPCVNQTVDDWVDMEYDTAVYVYSIEVCENLNPGMVTSLSAFNLNTGEWSTLWQGQATIQAPAVTIWAPSICEPLFPTNRIRLTVNTCASVGPVQISGVKLIGSVDPRRGVLTNYDGYVLYVPNQHVFTTDGDTFQYKTIDCPFDRTRESLAMTKTIIITPRNNQPVALAQNVSLDENFSAVIQLTSEDIDGDAVTYLINTLPTNGFLNQVDEKDNNLEEITKIGLLSNSRGRVRYSPPEDTCGMALDVFTFNVSDKELTSQAATITLNVYCLPGAHIISDVLFWVFFAIAILLGVISIAFIVIVGVFKEKQEFRVASPMLLIIMCVGFLLCLASVYFFAGPLTDAFCHLRVWLLSLGFALIIGTMFVKTYRIWRIFCNKTLKRRQLSDKWLAFILVAFIVVDVGVLIVFSVVGNSTVESYPSPTNPAATIQSCRFNYIIFYSLFGYKGLFLLFTVFLCFMIWNVKPAMPDFTALSVSVFTFAVCGLVLIPILLIITGGDPNPTAVFLGPALATIVPIAITLAVVFVPKAKELYKNRNKQSDMEFNLQINTASTVTTVSKQTNVTDFDDPAENKSVIELLETIKQKDDQIERLKNILAKKKYKIRSLKQRLMEAKQNQEPPSRSNMQSSEHS